MEHRTKGQKKILPTYLLPAHLSNAKSSTAFLTKASTQILLQKFPKSLWFVSVEENSKRVTFYFQLEMCRFKHFGPCTYVTSIF